MLLDLKELVKKKNISINSNVAHYVTRADRKSVLSAAGTGIFINIVGLNGILLLLNSTAFILNWELKVHFNLLNTNIFWILFTVLILYSFFIDSAIIDNKKRIYVKDPAKKSFRTIFSKWVPLLLSIALTAYLLYFIGAYFSIAIPFLNKDNTLHELYFIPLAIFILTVTIFYQFYREFLVRLFVRLLIYFHESFYTKVYKEQVEKEIFFSRSNKLNLWLVAFRINNFSQIKALVKRGNKHLLKEIMKCLKLRLRELDYIIPISFKDGAFAIVNYNPHSILDEFIHEKIEPVLEKDLRVDGHKLELETSWKCENLLKNEQIKDYDDLMDFVKNAVLDEY